MNNLSNEDIIKNYYHNPATGLGSIRTLYVKLRQEFPNRNITLKQVQDVVSVQVTHQVHKQIKIPLTEFNQIRSPGRGEFQIDLLDLSEYKSHNRNYRYVLVVEDIYSRYSFVEPLRNKNSDSVLDAMKLIENQILETIPRIWSFCMDAGSEFDNLKFNRYFSSVKMYRKSPKIHTTTGIVEARNHFFRNIIQRYFTSRHTLNWLTDIQNINDNINNSINRTTKETPTDIWNGKSNNNEEIRQKPMQFQVGDAVRLRKKLNTFEKATAGLFSNTVYKISEIIGLGYHLQNYPEKVFNWQLQKINGMEHPVTVTTRAHPKDISMKRKLNKKANRVNRVLKNLD